MKSYDVTSTAKITQGSEEIFKTDVEKKVVIEAEREGRTYQLNPNTESLKKFESLTLPDNLPKPTSEKVARPVKKSTKDVDATTRKTYYNSNALRPKKGQNLVDDTARSVAERPTLQRRQAVATGLNQSVKNNFTLSSQNQEIQNQVKSFIQENRSTWVREGKNVVIAKEKGINVVYDGKTKNIYVAKEHTSGLDNKISIGFNWDTGEEIVVRQRLPEHINPQESQRQFQLNKLLNDKNVSNVVQIKEHVTTATEDIMIMEKMKGKELQDLLTSDQPLSKKQVLQIAKGLIKTLSEMHALNITHGDIGPRNLFIDDENPKQFSTKLFDFDRGEDFGTLPSTVSDPQKWGDIVQTGKLLYALLNKEELKGKELKHADIKARFSKPSNKNSLKRICWEMLNEQKAVSLSKVMKRLDNL